MNSENEVFYILMNSVYLCLQSFGRSTKFPRNFISHVQARDSLNPALPYKVIKNIYVNSQSCQCCANCDNRHPTEEHIPPPIWCLAFEDEISRRCMQVSRYYCKSTVTDDQASGSLQLDRGSSNCDARPSGCDRCAIHRDCCWIGRKDLAANSEYCRQGLFS